MVTSCQVLFWINTLLSKWRKVGLIHCFASYIIICKPWNTSMQLWWQFLGPTKEPATPDYDNVPSASPSDWVDGRRSHTQKKGHGTWRESCSKLHILTLLGTNISPPKVWLKMIFLFPRWDMLVYRRVAGSTWNECLVAFIVAFWCQVPSLANHLAGLAASLRLRTAVFGQGWEVDEVGISYKVPHALEDESPMISSSLEEY